MDCLNRLQHNQKAWSDKVFGKDRNALSGIPHLKDEVRELSEAIDAYFNIHETATMSELADKIHNVKMEYADCFLLLMDSASLFPFTMDAIIKAMHEKFEINKKRQWHPPDHNGIPRHKKEHETLPVEDRLYLFMGEDNVRYMEIIKRLKGTYNCVLKLNAKKRGLPVHPVHLREGMQIRNWMRDQPEYKTANDNILDSEWMVLLDKTIKKFLI